MDAITEFVFRHAGGCLIESPDLLVPGCTSERRSRWVATLWADPNEMDGWGALLWEPGERGWLLPMTSAIGDVVEFGTGWTNVRGDVEVVRWWGWVQRFGARAVVLVGPYDHPIHAANDARQVVNEVRLSQLEAPDMINAVAAVFGDLREVD